MSRYLIVGEAWGAEEERARAPFVGASGRFLRGLLAEAGVRDYQLTNVFNQRPPGNEVKEFCGPKRTALPLLGNPTTLFPPLAKGKYIRQEFAFEIERLFKEIASCDPWRIIALGGTSLAVLTCASGIEAHRGRPMEASTGHQLMATWHPAAVLRSYQLRTETILDLAKATRPWEEVEREVWVPETLADLEQIRSYFSKRAVRVCDVETRDGQITEVGFAASKTRAFTIPFWYSKGNYWESLELERAAWSLVRELCEKPLVGQNFAYDIQYLWKVYGIPTPNFIGDTMLLQHAKYPELRKSLGYLASIHTDAPVWKNTRNLKEEDKEL